MNILRFCLRATLYVFLLIMDVLVFLSFVLRCFLETAAEVYPSHAVLLDRSYILYRKQLFVLPKKKLLKIFTFSNDLLVGGFKVFG